MTPLKSAFRTVHLWLGLASGLLVVVVCLTGSVLAFEKELEQAWHPARYFVAPAASRLPLAQVAAAVKAYKPGARISGYKVYADPGRTVEVSLAGAEPAGPGRTGEERGRGEAGRGASRPGAEPANKAGKGGKGEGGGPRVFVNPYTAAVTGELNPRDNFFKTVEMLHRGLVAGKGGKLLMGANAVVFLFILGTGLVLWWPATRRALSTRLQVKWGSSWKRLNHDFHIALGFYTSLFLLVLALTGVGMAFDWVGQGINQLTHSPTKRPEPPTSAVPPAPGAAPVAADAVLALARQLAPEAESYALQLPSEPTGSIRVAVLRPGAIADNTTDEVYLDQYSGQVVGRQPYAQRPAGQRIRGLFKPVHTGAIFGLPTKILAFVVGLLGATFPVTGTLMWLNRRRKRRQKQQQLQAV